MTKHYFCIVLALLAISTSAIAKSGVSPCNSIDDMQTCFDTWESQVDELKPGALHLLKKQASKLYRQRSWYHSLADEIFPTKRRLSFQKLSAAIENTTYKWTKRHETAIKHIKTALGQSFAADYQHIVRDGLQTARSIIAFHNYVKALGKSDPELLRTNTDTLLMQLTKDSSEGAITAAQKWAFLGILEAINIDQLKFANKMGHEEELKSVKAERDALKEELKTHKTWIRFETWQSMATLKEHQHQAQLSEMKAAMAAREKQLEEYHHQLLASFQAERTRLEAQIAEMNSMMVAQEKGQETYTDTLLRSYKDDFDADEHENLAEEKAQSKLSNAQSSLIKYEMADNTPLYKFDPVLSETNYRHLLKINDLSYAVAKLQTVTDTKKRGLVEQRKASLEEDLIQSGWIKPIVFKGKTGYLNRNDDDTGVLSYHQEKNLIVVSFHGSRSGSMLSGVIYNNGDGDWGANYDYTPVNGDVLVSDEHPQSYVPADIQIHRGYANNFKSAQDNLLKELDNALDQFVDKNPWIIVTGHSKGGAMAALAAPIIKLYVEKRAKVGAILFSAPRVFHGDEARNWVHKTMGKRNILRVNVYGDPATQVPRKGFGYSYRSVGMLALDNVSHVDGRITDLNRSIPGWFDVKGWIGRYHYGLGRDGGLGFEPDIVLTYSELLEALNQGLAHAGETMSKSSLQRSTFVF